LWFYVETVRIGLYRVKIIVIGLNWQKTCAGGHSGLLITAAPCCVYFHSIKTSLDDTSLTHPLKQAAVSQ
jgi:hypothetical protein